MGQWLQLDREGSDFNGKRHRKELMEHVDHPPHYGGADNPYEAIKVIEALGLGFHLGNTVKYIFRAGRKGDAITDLEKAAWYLQRKIDTLKTERAQIESLASERQRSAHLGDALASDRGLAAPEPLDGPKQDETASSLSVEH